MYRTYAQDQDPAKLFKRAADWLTVIKELGRDEKKGELIEKDLIASMSCAIFGSNQIERAGLGLDTTIELCHRIFNGEDVTDLDERTPEYEKQLKELIERDKGLENMPIKHVIRGRREIVQHAKAFYYMIYAVVVVGEPLSEALIKKVHGILCKNVPITHRDGSETPSRDYAGQYRHVPVGTGSTMFTAPGMVPTAMARMIRDFNEDIRKIEETGQIDPFALASKYCLDFVQIHPFQDGNGRTCRMILNAILCKYAGIVVPIGEREQERSEYLNIKIRSSNQMEGAGELATFVLGKAMTRIRTIKKKLAGKKASAEEQQ